MVKLIDGGSSLRVQTRNTFRGDFLLKVFNDIHADPDLTKRILSLKVSEGDIIVANGDFVGSRGPIANQIVKVYYEVKRGEASKYELEKLFSALIGVPVFIEDDLIFHSVHSGTFLAEMCRRYDKFQAIIEDETLHNLAELDRVSKRIEEQGGRLVYLPGNCEISFCDYDITNGVNCEKTLPPKERLFNRLNKEGAFSNTEYVNEPKIIGENTLLIPLDFLDEWITKKTVIPYAEKATNLIVHYPPLNQYIAECFHMLFGYTLNAMDKLRMNAVSEIIDCLPNLKIVVFGHIHPGITKESTEKLPMSVIFREKDCQLIWNSPGNVFAFC